MGPSRLSLCAVAAHKDLQQAGQHT
jgi:hypothetical protein